MTEEKQKRKVEDIRTWTWRRTIFIAALAVVYGLVMYAIFFNVGTAGSYPTLQTSPATIAFLVVVPTVIGGISTYAIPKSRRTIRNMVFVAIPVGLLFLAITVVAAYPGILLCVLMATPLVLGAVIIGVIIGKLFAYLESRANADKRKRQYVFVGFLFLPLLLAPIEAQITPSDWYRTVQDEITIQGTAAEVWQHIIRMETITPQEQRPSLYHTLGIPRPIRATLDFEGVGGVRLGEFEFGLQFYEEITIWNPEREVRFSVDIRQNPQSTPVLEQIGGARFDIIEAGYVIEIIDADHVILRLDSTYRISTTFNFYGAFWSDWIMHDFQQYVLNTVKQRVQGHIE